jgi:GTPase-activator protein for Ras-like GTPase
MLRRGKKRQRNNDAAVVEQQIEVRRELSGDEVRLRDLMLDNSESLLKVLDTVLGTDDMATFVWSMIRVFQSYSEIRVQSVLQWLLESEVADTLDEATLFRGSSVCTKVVSRYMTDVGKQFLSASVLPEVERWARDGGWQLDFELDERRMDAPLGDDEAAKRRAGVEGAASDILGALEARIARDECPVPLCRLFEAAQRIVAQRFPSMREQVVGGFFFLRFVCPFIVAPPIAGVTRGGRRRLVLISKLVQNLSNNIAFGDKEAFMVPFNAFLKANAARMSELLANVTRAALERRPASLVGELGDSEDRGRAQCEAIESIRGTLATHQYIVCEMLRESNEPLAESLAECMNTFRADVAVALSPLPAVCDSSACGSQSSASSSSSSSSSRLLNNLTPRKLGERAKSAFDSSSSSLIDVVTSSPKRLRSGRSRLRDSLKRRNTFQNLLARGTDDDGDGDNDDSLSSSVTFSHVLDSPRKRRARRAAKRSRDGDTIADENSADNNSTGNVSRTATKTPPLQSDESPTKRQRNRQHDDTLTIINSLF